MAAKIAIRVKNLRPCGFQAGMSIDQAHVRASRRGRNPDQ